jgi:hypothetical protein
MLPIKYAHLLRAQQPSIYYVQDESHLRPSLRLPTDDAATRRCQPGLWARLDCRDPGVWFSGSIAHVKIVNWRLHQCGKLITSRVREDMPMRRSPKHGNAAGLIRRSRCFKIVWHNPDEVVESSCFETRRQGRNRHALEIAGGPLSKTPYLMA